jgi:hypothetical protein
MTAVEHTSLCWCGASFVEVTLDETLSGLTRPCRIRACIETDRAQRGVDVYDRVVVPEPPPPAVAASQLVAAIDTLADLGQIVRTERRRRGLDQASAARQCGVGLHAFVALELSRGKRGPGLVTTLKVLAWLMDDRSTVLAELNAAKKATTRAGGC